MDGEDQSLGRIDLWNDPKLSSLLDMHRGRPIGLQKTMMNRFPKSSEFYGGRRNNFLHQLSGGKSGKLFELGNIDQWC